MNRCALCGRKINNREFNFGLGCLKKACTFLQIKNVKNLKGEYLLNNKIQRLCNCKKLPTPQSRILTDRYLSLTLLNEVPLKEYDKYRQAIQNDISLINRKTKLNELSSFNVLTLKQASEVNKMYKKNENIFKKIMNGDYDLLQNISFMVVNLAFSLYYNRKPYLSDMNQKLQLYVLKGGVLGLRMGNYNFAADCLEHSLEQNPKDIHITEGKTIQDIQEDVGFKEEINSIIEENKNKKSFEISKVVTFANGDLMLALHDVTLQVKGEKQKGNKWKLEIEILDLYDFTDLKELEEYVNGDNFFKGFVTSTANNLAMIATSCKIVSTYNIEIKFTIENWEV